MPAFSNESPFNALPPVVLALTAAVVLPELVFQLGSAGLIGGAQGVGLRIEALNAAAVSPPLFERMWQLGLFPPGQMTRLVLYPFVHLGLAHMAFAAVFLLALGKMVGETMGQAAVVVIFVASAIVGALAYVALTGTNAALVGAYPPAYGLIGGFTFILWTGLGRIGQSRARAFTLIAFLMGIQLFFGLAFGGGLDWVADLAGFATGFAVSFVVAPGGWRRLVDKLRQR